MTKQAPINDIPEHVPAISPILESQPLIEPVIPNAEEEGISKGVLVSREDFLNLAKLYSWQNRKSRIVDVNGINPETNEPETYRLLPYYGEVAPHYSLEPTTLERDKIRFYGLWAGERKELLPLKSSPKAPDEFTEEDRRILASILPSVSSAAEALDTMPASKQRRHTTRRVLSRLFRKSLNE